MNQLTIAEVNPTGLPYIDADTIDQYRIRASHYIDLTCTDAHTLYAKGSQILEELKHPRYTYTAKAAHLYKMTGNDWYHFEEGRCVRLIDGGKIDITTTIIEVSKSDVEGNPLDIDIVLSNKSSDVASTIEDLTRRTSITAQYSQGATNLYSQQFADNADGEHPATMRVYIPSDCAKINSILLSWSVEKFRAYSRGSSAGGSETVLAAQQLIDCFAITEGPSGDIRDYTGASTPLIHEAGAHKHNGPSHCHSFEGSQSLANNHAHAIAEPGTSTTTGLADANATHDVSISGNTGYAGTGETSEAGAHTHTMNEHTHAVWVNHWHDVLVSVNVPEQAIVIPSHSHGINYGIYEGGKAENVTITVDDTEIPAEELASKEMDIVKYLAKDSNGKITRGTWHTIEIAPDALARIEANLFVQTFVTSHSGGSY